MRSTKPAAGSAPRVVVMGVSASGKSAVGVELAKRMNVRFVDADDLHPLGNVVKMASGVPLDDDDRWPWLDSVARELAKGGGAVIACSALKKSYRDRLRTAAPDAVFVHLSGSGELLTDRAARRAGHFMPPALLLSQLEALEPLTTDEDGIQLDVDVPVAALTLTALEWVNARAR